MSSALLTPAQLVLVPWELSSVVSFPLLSIKPWLMPLLSTYAPTMTSALLVPKTRVSWAPLTSMVVNLKVSFGASAVATKTKVRIDMATNRDLLHFFRPAPGGKNRFAPTHLISHEPGTKDQAIFGV